MLCVGCVSEWMGMRWDVGDGYLRDGLVVRVLDLDLGLGLALHLLLGRRAEVNLVVVLVIESGRIAGVAGHEGIDDLGLGLLATGRGGRLLGGGTRGGTLATTRRLGSGGRSAGTLAVVPRHGAGSLLTTQLLKMLPVEKKNVSK